jgi:hypothetical protein
MKTKTHPEIAFLRLRNVIGGKDNPGIIPVSRSSRAEEMELSFRGMFAYTCNANFDLPI